MSARVHSYIHKKKASECIEIYLSANAKGTSIQRTLEPSPSLSCPSINIAIKSWPCSLW